MPPSEERLVVPYAGSGSEMIAAAQAGWEEVLGIELDQDYIEIAQRRIGYWLGKAVSA